MRSDIRYCIFCFYFLYEKSDFQLSKNKKGIWLIIDKSPSISSFYAIEIKQTTSSYEFSCCFYRHPNSEYLDFKFDLSVIDHLETCIPVNNISII